MAAAIPDQTGKTHLVTGANTGIGLETARAIAGAGGRVVLLVRDRNKGEVARRDIIKTTQNEQVHLLVCDLAVRSDIRDTAEVFRRRFDRLDVLVNNAGVWRGDGGRTADGVERTVAVNHLAPFLLTHLLLPTLRASAPARIVNVASEAHRGVTLDRKDILAQTAKGDWRQYQRTKLMNILFTRTLARRLAGSGVTADCLHPGVVATELFRSVPRPFHPLMRLFMLSPRRGARTSVYLATARALRDGTGGYYVRKKLREPTAAACDVGLADELWSASQRVCGIRDYGEPEP